MDKTRIGQFVTQKRIERNLTKSELAEKSGISNKAMDKLERGVSLPDVLSCRLLCDLLEIKLNEFFAGADLSEDRIVQKSEEALIMLATENKIKLRRLTWLAYLLCLLCAISIMIMAIVVGLI